ncbi:MAG: hypothetical protein AAGA48_21345 [Myxococcota bacterium]
MSWSQQTWLARRSALIGFAAACGVPWSSPKEPDPLGALDRLRPVDTGRWFAEARRAGAAGPDVLRDALRTALKRCVETLDLHPLLIFGPAWRLAPEDDRLLLWILVQVTDWWEFSGCSGDPALRNAHAGPKGLLPRTSDVHPAILASEAAFLESKLPQDLAQDLLGRAARISGRGPAREELLHAVGATGAAMARAEPQPVSPEEVAHSVLTLGDGALDALVDASPPLGTLWHGLWLAAASAWLGYGGPLNPTHTITGLSATQRLASTLPGPGPWIGAAAMAARLAMDAGPMPPFGVVQSAWSVADAPPRSVWRDRARRPGPDLHDLKFCEAIAHAPIPDPIFAVVSGLATRSGRLEAAPWPVLEAAWEQFSHRSR